MAKTPNEILFEQASPDKVMPIVYLWRAIWKYVFDEQHCSFEHRKEIETEILKWNSIIQIQKTIRNDRTKGQFDKGSTGKVGQKGNVIDELEYQTGMMCKTLVDNENGLWDYHKDTLRIHNIDYRKSIHCNEWFPEVQDPDRFARGIANLKEAQKENPEDYKNDV